jgi:serine/threonine protein kinase
LLKKYATEILEALNYIHSKGVVHADLKLANICLDRDWEDDEENIKLIDFGLSLVTSPELNGKATMKYPVGTQGYMAPELKGVSLDFNISNLF